MGTVGGYLRGWSSLAPRSALSATPASAAIRRPRTRSATTGRPSGCARRTRSTESVAWRDASSVGRSLPRRQARRCRAGRCATASASRSAPMARSTSRRDDSIVRQLRLLRHRVDAPSDSLVITAGHCAYECVPVLFDCEPTRSTNFNFVPAFKNGDKPFGEWPARGGGVRATPQYENNESLGYDVGARGDRAAQRQAPDRTCYRRARDRLQPEAKTSLPRLWLSAAPSLRTASRPTSAAAARAARTTASTPRDPDLLQHDRGATGGGWVIDGGRVASVASYGYGTQPKKLYGPYFGTAIPTSTTRSRTTRNG